MADYGQRAGIYFRGYLADTSEVFDERLDGEPFEFVVGSGVVPVGVERAVRSMEVGDEVEVTLSPAEAFGEYCDDACFKIPTFMIPNAEDLPIGKYIDIRSQDGVGFAHAKVVDVRDCVAYFDMNHPLAGKRCVYQIKLADLT